MRSETGGQFMTHSELWERINLTMEDSPCVIEYDRKNGFTWWEDGLPKSTPGVAVAMVGHRLDERFLVRGYRALLLDWEWSYLMHFEMAIDALFDGNIIDYNYTGHFPFVKYQFLPSIDEDNYMLLKKLFV